MTQPSDGLPGVSVVICTTGRIKCLPRTVDSIRAQTYRPLEIVLVVGPCRDGTDDYARTLADAKVVFVPVLNLSHARNQGIRAAGGSIIAFIDDDAVANPRWVEELVRGLEAEGEDCGGIGGATFNESDPGRPVQWRYGAVSELGEGIDFGLEPRPDVDPTGTWFARLHGTNMAFRREALLAVGGFDEVYEYVHDETDLCVSLIRHGYRIAQHGRAWVHHFPAPSHNRSGPYEQNWYVLLKNNGYFALKHSRRSVTTCGRAVAGRHFCFLKALALWAVRFNISPWSWARNTAAWWRGLFRGLQLGLAWRRCRPPSALSAGLARPSFLPINELPRPPGVRTAPRRLRIGLVCNEFTAGVPGGIATYTRHLAEGLSDRGHSVVVFHAGPAPRGPRHQAYQLVAIPADGHVPHQTNLGRALLSPAGRQPFDIVEAPLWAGEACSVGLSGQCPLVVRLETPFEVVRQLCGLPLCAHGAAAVAAERLELSYAAGLIAISQAIWRTVEEVYDARLATVSRQATVIPLGLPDADTALLQPAEVPEGPGPHFLFVGRLEARKGVEELGTAFTRVARCLPTATLWIVGADNSGHDGFAQRTGASYPDWLTGHWDAETGARVRFFGAVSEGVKNYLTARCDVFVGPSRYESFGLVFLEAMRFGKAVVATKTGGIPEIVRHEQTGLLVPGQSPDELAEAMVRLGGDASLRARLGAAGRRRFEQEFTLYQCARRTESFYYQVLAAWHGSTAGQAAPRRPGELPQALPQGSSRAGVTTTTCTGDCHGPRAA